MPKTPKPKLEQQLPLDLVATPKPPPIDWDAEQEAFDAHLAEVRVMVKHYLVICDRLGLEPDPILADTPERTEYDWVELALALLPKHPDGQSGVKA
jgi:hypothetical protein